MTTILLAEDSMSQTAVIKRLLEGADFQVETARDGEEALKAIANHVPDIVLTDLVMPGMNGMELVQEIRKQYSYVPVVLMTAFGNEEIAIQALQAGAANYVPKRNLEREIVSILYDVLSVSGEKRQQERLLNSLDEVDLRFLLRNEVALISPLVKQLQDQMASMNLCDETGLIRAGTALCEALTNALIHGNLEVSSSLRKQDGSAYSDMIEKRSREKPYEDRRVSIEARLSRSETVFVIRDQGPGFDLSTIPDPTDPENLEKPSGRGLLLIQTFMNEVKFNETGNEVTMVLRSDG